MLVRTRYFFVGSALIVAVGLCAGLVAYYGGNLPLRASTIGPAELTYLPSATTGVAYANVRDIMNSEFRRRLSNLLPSGAGKHQLLAETGIDLEEDIDSVVAGFGSSGDSAGPPGALRRQPDRERCHVARRHRPAAPGPHVADVRRGGPRRSRAGLSRIRPGGTGGTRRVAAGH
jgi:hypothetical protein